MDNFTNILFKHPRFWSCSNKLSLLLWRNVTKSVTSLTAIGIFDQMDAKMLKSSKMIRLRKYNNVGWKKDWTLRMKNKEELKDALPQMLTAVVQKVDECCSSRLNTKSLSLLLCEYVSLCGEGCRDEKKKGSQNAGGGSTNRAEGFNWLPGDNHFRQRN